MIATDLFHHSDNHDAGHDDDNSNNNTEVFYNALARHATVRILKMDGDGRMMNHPIGFLSALQKNDSLDTVQIDIIHQDENDDDDDGDFRDHDDDDDDKSLQRLFCCLLLLLLPAAWELA